MVTKELVTIIEGRCIPKSKLPPKLHVPRVAPRHVNKGYLGNQSCR